ncbi:hypothetical protein CFP56_020359 [Quercus suber]|uniref:Uncharacterized protein n=1 Tax=Quercus suber TaxID=58331 RepID=A0AAW0KHH4_QUESU
MRMEPNKLNGILFQLYYHYHAPNVTLQ